MIVDIIREDRYIIIEDAEIDHPVSKGDVILITQDYTIKGTKTYEVLRIQTTVHVPLEKPTSFDYINQEVIVKEIETR